MTAEGFVDQKEKSGYRAEDLTHQFISWSYNIARFWYVGKITCELRLLYTIFTLYKLKYILRKEPGKLFRGVLGWALLWCQRLIPRVSAAEL